MIISRAKDRFYPQKCNKGCRLSLANLEAVSLRCKRRPIDTTK